MAWLNDIKQKIRGRLRMKALSKFGVGYFVDTPQGLYVVDPVDQEISRRLIKCGESDVQSVNLLSRFIGPTDTIMFIGAHIGSLLVPLAKKAKKTYGFDADPKNFRYLSYNVKLNELQNVFIRNCAVGDKEGIRIKIRHDDLNSGHSSIMLSEGQGENSVEMIRIDNHVNENVRLVVLDIEGAEVHALRGMTELLKKTDILYVEFSNIFMRNLGESCKAFCKALKDYYPFAKIYYENNPVFKDSEWVNYLEKFDYTDQEVVINCLLSKDYTIIEEADQIVYK